MLNKIKKKPQQKQQINKYNNITHLKAKTVIFVQEIYVFKKPKKFKPLARFEVGSQDYKLEIVSKTPRYTFEYQHTCSVYCICIL